MDARAKFREHEKYARVSHFTVFCSFVLLAFVTALTIVAKKCKEHIKCVQLIIKHLIRESD